jgi:hypothetical protein
LKECESKRVPSKFEDLFPEADEKALDLLKKLLCFDPSERLSAE